MMKTALILLIAAVAGCSTDAAPQFEANACAVYAGWTSRTAPPYIDDAGAERIEVDYAPLQPLWGVANALHNTDGDNYGMAVTQPLALHWIDGTTHTGTVLRVDDAECYWVEAR